MERVRMAVTANKVAFIKPPDRWVALIPVRYGNWGKRFESGEPAERSIRYSYRRDSTGSTLAAFLAGKNPAARPIRDRIPVVRSVVVAERMGLPRNCIAPSSEGMRRTPDMTA